MPRSLSITRANVTTPSGALVEDAVVSARRTTFLVRKGRGRTASTVVLEEGTVEAVLFRSKQRWQVVTSNGTYDVVDLGCGCT